MSTKAMMQFVVVPFISVCLVPCICSAQVASAPVPQAALSDLSADHVTLSVQDMDKESDWYDRVLGFKVTARMERPRYTGRQLRNASFRIDLIHFPGSVRTPADPVYMHQGWVRVALKVSDLPAALIALKSLATDVTANGSDGRGGPAVLLLHDPEGNEVEIFSTNIPH